MIDKFHQNNVTEDLLRRRAEHNECEIFSLEEVSLHQQDVERIEHIDRWCRDLKILYLQNNLIPRIENLSRLKKLQYLNLALNNIEVIENLEGCESLQKLDLTVNFVGRLSSVDSLKHNIHLTELFLVGNPCTEFEGYRQYVVTAVPQLKCLDGTEISRSERIRASQGLEEVKRRVWEQEKEYLKRRAREKEEAQREAAGDEKEEAQREAAGDEKEEAQREAAGDEKEEAQREAAGDEKEEAQREAAGDEKGNKERKPGSDTTDLLFDERPSFMFPPSRASGHKKKKKQRKKKKKFTEKKPKAPRTLITADGRVMNVNEPKLDFSLTEDEDNNTVVLDLSVYRHMDTSLMDVDVQPTYARVRVKGKIFQIVLPAEVKPDSSTAQRSQTTGHLVLTMPRAGGDIKVTKTVPRPRRARQDGRSSSPEDSKRDYIQVLDSLQGRHGDYVQVLDSLRGRHRDYIQVLDSLQGRRRDYVQVLDSLLGRHGDYVQVLDSLRGRLRDYVQVLDSLNKNVPERLEVDPSKRTTVDLANIVPRQRSSAEGPLETSRVDPPTTTGHSRTSEEFVDDPEVPPLI
ncbi:Protein tilB -like protein [Collichthys lucidus]|uniref:Leucine-rich repeat-containing protein 6 n=1 Tax=Collichthys lucidus TaxID=240159 RepID=A0A4U5UVN2_COLLU|nr:Protein tilB -like protein [Collichthys lucidus]